MTNEQKELQAAIDRVKAATKNYLAAIETAVNRKPSRECK